MKYPRFVIGIEDREMHGEEGNVEMPEMRFNSPKEATDYIKAFAEQNDLENFGDEKDNGDSEKRSDLETEGVTIEK